ncbi:unnamed protein product [Adineta steineri]|uniref:NAD(P)(+)--arginine ADP-ribosyltransferase n=1 Tax=Adineta steineri TaxID=433720 RepID=A0A819QF77_9BILA|nr:unnamed protein product [Adineta steineri]
MDYSELQNRPSTENARTQTEEIGIPPVSKNVRTQTELTTIGTDNETMQYRRKSKRRSANVISDPSSLLMNVTYQNIDDKDTGGRNSELLPELVEEDANNFNEDSADTDQRRGESNETGQKLTDTSTPDETEPSTEPIIDYANEPLLPLAEACAPLNDILHNISFYVKLALEETPSPPLDNLTVDESAAIRLYTIEWDRPHRSLYSSLNYTLKTQPREKLIPYYKYMKLFITALVKLPCVPPCTVWRGVTKDLSAEFPPGTPVTWWAFSSTTTELTVLENNMYLGASGSRTLFSVEAINGRTIKAHSHFVTEDELLLLPGTYMVVQSLFSPAPDLNIVHLKQEIPKDVLLQPPYEGAHIFPKIKRPWYTKKRFAIPLVLSIIAVITAAIIGVVMGLKSAKSVHVCTTPYVGTAAFFQTGNFPISGIAGTFDNDTNLDIIVTNQQDDEIVVLYGDGQGNFPSQSKVNICYSEYFILFKISAD